MFLSILDGRLLSVTADPLKEERNMATPQQQKELIALTTMMFNAPPGAEYLAEYEGYLDQGLSIAQVAVNLAATDTFNSQFAGMNSDDAKINMVLEWFGIDTDSLAYQESFNFFTESLAAGRNPGEVLADAAEFLATTEDETFSEASATFRNKVETGVKHSIELGLPSGNLDVLKNAIVNVTSDTQSVAIATQALNDEATLNDGGEVEGQTLTLTTAVDNLLGSDGNDIFTGTRGDGAGPYTFNIGDILDGLGGTDTLNITTGAEASTPSDALWTGISNFEKVIFKSFGNGAQSITTGDNFQAAFGVQGVDVTAKTLLGAIDLTMASFTGTADITTITEGAGAHSIVTGSGVSTVNATGISAGAQTINGAGMTTVTATINGAGNQVIGTTQGGNLVSVKATILAAGDQTIASTSDSNVTVVASAAAGAQTVTTAGGNDSITTIGTAGNAGTISTGAGNDTIVAGLTTALITGGTGSDTMTGGGGVDTFAFGADGSVIGTDRDIITDFNTAGADILSFSGETIVLTADSSALVAGENVQTFSGGLITFAATDDTLDKKVIAIQADAELDVAGSVGMFIDSGNTYVYYAGANAGNDDDQLIQLTGIDTLTTMTGGATLTID